MKLLAHFSNDSYVLKNLTYIFTKNVLLAEQEKKILHNTGKRMQIQFSRHHRRAEYCELCDILPFRTSC